LRSSQCALDLVAERLARMLWSGDLRFAGERKRQLHRVARPSAFDEDVHPPVGELARARAVSLQRPRRRRAREPQRDRLLAAGGEVELFALEARRIERTGIGKRLSRLADGEDSVDAKRALRLAPDVVP